uniref:Uncharacterized protein n=1 Tax=Rhizophora mucronata TaxID=61149 RepID=A0A2P2R142_RHIMU
MSPKLKQGQAVTLQLLHKRLITTTDIYENSKNFMQLDPYH